MSDVPPGRVSIPARDWIYTRAAMSLMRVQECLPDGSEFSFNAHGSTICAKRNAAVARLLEKDGLDWLLFLDSDQVYPDRIARHLLTHDADIVGGLVCLKGPPFLACAGWETDPGARSDDPLRPTDADGWTVDTLNLLRQGTGGDGPGVMEVDVVGSGCMLIRRPVLEAMEPPWFVANRRDMEMYEANEDYNFCLRAKDQGFSVVCDTAAECEHIGPYGTTPSMVRAWKLDTYRQATRERPGASLQQERS